MPKPTWYIEGDYIISRRSNIKLARFENGVLKLYDKRLNINIDFPIDDYLRLRQQTTLDQKQKEGASHD